MLKLLFLFIFTFGGASAQDSTQTVSEEEAYRQRILEEYSASKNQPGDAQAIQDAEKDELDQALEDTTQSLSNLGGMNAQGEPLENVPVDTPEDVSEGHSPKKPVEIKESFLSGVMSSAAKKFVGEFLSENPFSKIPRNEMKSLVEGRLAGLPFGKFLNDNPKVLDFFVDFLRDKRALPNILGLVNKPEKVKTFGSIAIGVFILVFILNLFNSKGNIFKRILRKLCIGALAFVCNLGAFYFIFREEITPTLNIVFKYFHL